MALGYKKALAALEGGGRLMVTHPDPRRADSKPVYGILPEGRQVSEAAFKRLLPDLSPCADGLFGADISQIYQWTPK